MALRPKLTLYVDVISPFAYLSHHIIRTSPVFKPCDVEIVPVFLGGIMEAAGNRPPMTIKNKGEYIGFERDYFARKFGLEFGPRNPEPFPQLTVHTMRAVCAVQALHPEKMNDYFTALFRVFWFDLKPISKPEVFGGVLEQVLGDKAEAEKVLQHAASAEIKAALKKNTDEAFASGAFGLPWYVAQNARGEKQGFWGISHLGMAVEFLGLDSSVDPGFKSML